METEARLHALFAPLAPLVSHIPTTLRGRWSEEAVPDSDFVHTSFDAELSSESAIVILLGVADAERVAWARPGLTKATTHTIRWMMGGWSPASRSAQGMASSHDATVSLGRHACTNKPPAGTRNAEPEGETGRVRIVGGWDDVVCFVVAFAKGDVTVGRNHLWHLRDESVASASLGIARAMKSGRRGEAAWSEL